MLFNLPSLIAIVEGKSHPIFLLRLLIRLQGNFVYNPSDLAALSVKALAIRI